MPQTRLEYPSGYDDPMEGNCILVDCTFGKRRDKLKSVSCIGLYIYNAKDRWFETEIDIPLGYTYENRGLFLLDRINPGLYS